MSLLIFTPTFDDAMRTGTKASIQTQVTDVSFVWEVGFHNPYPGRKFANVVAQYQRAREIALSGGYDAMLTVEHDIVLPSDAVQKLWNTDAPIVYGVYMFRHGPRILNALQKLNDRNLGMSLSFYPQELKAARQKGSVEVSGMGWGCTLIRREVLEKIEIRGGDHDAGDMTFAGDCLRAGIRQVARFDVPCGHFDGATLLMPYGIGGAVSQVEAQQNVNANVNGQTVPMVKGKTYSIPFEVATELQRAGYVRILDEGGEQPDIAQRETAVDPKTTKRSTRGGKRA